MSDQKTHDVLTLFALVIFADKRVFAREIEAFVDICMHTFPRHPEMQTLNEGEILFWYEKNRSEIKSYLSHPEFETKFMALLDRLDPVPGKDQILSSMNYIAAADDEVHVSEEALIVLARRKWDS